MDGTEKKTLLYIFFSFPFAPLKHFIRFLYYDKLYTNVIVYKINANFILIIMKMVVIAGLLFGVLSS